MDNNVTFNEDTTAQRPVVPRKMPGLYRLAITLGLAKDEAGAKGVLIVIAVIAIIIAVVYPLLIL